MVLGVMLRTEGNFRPFLLDFSNEIVYIIELFIKGIRYYG